MKRRSLIALSSIGLLPLAGCGTSATPTNAAINNTVANVATSTSTSFANSDLSTVMVGNVQYSINNPNNEISMYLREQIALTHNGVVWVLLPPRSNPYVVTSAPTRSYALYLSPAGTTILTPSHAKLLLKEPLYVTINGQRAYLNLFGPKVYGDDVIYSTDYFGANMPQPFYSELWALNLTTRKTQKVASYHDGGGDFFAYGVSDGYIITQQQKPAAGVSYTYTLTAFNLQTGTKVVLPSSDASAGNAVGRVVATIGGKKISVKLKNI